MMDKIQMRHIIKNLAPLCLKCIFSEKKSALILQKTVVDMIQEPEHKKMGVPLLIN